LRRADFFQSTFPEFGEQIIDQVAAVLGYCLGFQDLAFGGPSRKVGGVFREHIPGKVPYGYVLSPGAPGAALGLFVFEIHNQGYGAGLRVGF
jgi:hypothetical protein